MRLNPLKPGDRIALVAPASPFDQEKLARAVEVLEGRGYRLAPGKHVTCKKGYLAGTEAERATDLIDAIHDPDVAAILCVRGGYGSARLLPWLPFPVLEERPKIFMGYSDITFLHLAFQSRMQWVTFHGPNLIDLADAPPDQVETLLSSLSGEKEFAWGFSDDQVLRHGMAAGTVIGGNLTCLVHLLGTPYFPNLRGQFLLIEDCGEALYRLDRHMNHLLLAGALDRLGGLILGTFKDCGDSQAIHQMVMEQVSSFQFPVIAGLPFGHMPQNEVIPFGIPFTLNTYEYTFKATQSPFNH
jgi:muramoyltetrapeptide carboxypeptidase